MGRHGCSVESALGAGAARLRGNGDRTGERSTTPRGGLAMDGRWMGAISEGEIQGKSTRDVRNVGSILPSFHVCSQFSSAGTPFANQSLVYLGASAPRLKNGVNRRDLARMSKKAWRPPVGAPVPRSSD